MPSPLDDVCCAFIPQTQLAGLASVRCTSGVGVIEAGEHCWLLWEPGQEDILRQVLPLRDVQLFVQRGGRWYRFGSRLPVAGPPDNGQARPLHRVLIPEPMRQEKPPVHALQPCLLRLVRDAVPRPATALETPIATLNQWADHATSSQLEQLQGALTGQRVLLLGNRLPLLPASERFWGRRILVPLGFRPEPDLPESAVAEALHLGDKNLALVGRHGVEIVPENVIQPLTRAGIRLACRELHP